MKGVVTTTTASRRRLSARGVLLLAFGLTEGGLVLMVAYLPYVTASLLVLVMAGFVIVDGLMVLVEAVGTTGRARWLMAMAVVGMAAGVLMLLVAPIWSIAIFAWWAIVTGVLQGIEFMGSGPRHVVVAALSIAFGLLVLAGPVADAVLVLLMIAVYGVIAGGVQLGAARSVHPGPPASTVWEDSVHPTRRSPPAGRGAATR